MSKDTGGPAFPVPGSIHGDGMTLRDYFAAKALQGIMACPDVTGDNEKVARWAYGAADAMIKERNK